MGWWHAENSFGDEFGPWTSGASAGAGAVTFAPGAVGNAFAFQRQRHNSYVTIPDSSELDAIATTRCRHDGRLDRRRPALGEARILDKITAGGVDGYMLDTLGGKLRMIVGNGTVTSTTALPTGTWTHVAGVYDGANITVYINGVSVGTGAHTGAIPSNALALRIGGELGGRQLTRQAIDEVRVWKRGMTAAQIATLYAAGRARMTQASGQMVAWFSGDSAIAPAADVLGVNNGLTGTGVTTQLGILATAQSFPGTGVAFSTSPDSSSLDVTSTVTMDAWINATALGGRIIDKITANGANGYLLDTVGGKLRILTGTGSVQSTAPLPTGTWTHVAGVYDGANLTVYINGSEAGTSAHTGAIPTNALTLRLGADSTGANLFGGAIDEARIYSRALSAADILALYDEGACQ